MNACLAILAHSGAKPTVQLFEPRWRKLGVPIYAFVPAGDEWPGGPVGGVIKQGQSARTGQAVFERFLDTCKTLLHADYDVYIIAEYDTVNLNNHLPRFDASAIGCGYVSLYGPYGQYEAKCCFSPWVVTRAMLAAFVEAMQMGLRRPATGHLGKWVEGYLDRWIGACVLRAQLPMMHLPDVLPYPWDEKENVHQRIIDERLTWVHGWKTKEEFKHLWPNQ